VDRERSTRDAARTYARARAVLVVLAGAAAVRWFSASRVPVAAGGVRLADTGSVRRLDACRTGQSIVVRTAVQPVRVRSARRQEQGGEGGGDQPVGPAQDGSVHARVHLFSEQCSGSASRSTRGHAAVEYAVPHGIRS
jgi:hypothetical protein